MQLPAGSRTSLPPTTYGTQKYRKEKRGVPSFSTDIGPQTTKDISTLLQVLKVRRKPNSAGGLKGFTAKDHDQSVVEARIPKPPHGPSILIFFFLFFACLHTQWRFRTQKTSCTLWSTSYMCDIPSTQGVHAIMEVWQKPEPFGSLKFQFQNFQTLA